MTITRCKVHPAIGIARVGDSPDEFFDGPQRPGASGLPSGDSYKDGAGYVKRQAACFRVFGYDDDGNVVRELTDAEVEIRWTVHLANRKAAAPLFGDGDEAVVGLRNQSVPEARRGSLVIDPGERTISGREVRGSAEHRFDTGTFEGIPVDLGELRTDQAGRLVVLGGHGRAESPSDASLNTFADNDGWFDDTSDGPVRAQVTLRDTGAPLSVDPSWVIVAPPDFAPSIGNIVTLHDVVEQVAFESGRLPMPEKVNFERDIRPFLERVAGYQWVDATAFRGHRRGDHSADDTKEVERRGDFLDQALLTLLASSGGPAEKARRRVFERVRAPLPSDEPTDAQAKARAEEQATAWFMPPLSGDGGQRTEGKPGTWLTVTPLQYRRLELWADGDFDVEDRAQDGGDTGVSPADLDRTALENCVGGGFFPGIEVSKRIKDPSLYMGDKDGFPQVDGYRLDHDHKDLRPGALTERMAVPWQADFFKCEGFWWPAQRPDQVVVDKDYESVVASSPSKGNRSGPFGDALAFPRRRWARGIGRHLDMVDSWSKLGFVVPRTDDVTVWTETERDRYLGLQDREYFHIMLNLDKHPAFRPTAKELAKAFIAEAHDNLELDDELDTELHLFAYDDLAFATRLDSIYQYLVDQVAGYDPAEDGTCHSREDVIERIRQFGPLNRTDGEWLRNVKNIHPRTEVTDLLNQIWDDEIGGGDPLHNHSNIYTELMRSVGPQPADVKSDEYVRDPELLDSAFTVPLLQYVVSEFTEDFLPEILGMTLHFEWESVYLKVIIRLFQKYDIDPHFYQLHLAIDNVAEGHGALATRAVRRYLADYEGDELQQQWRRIWDGYVAFREAGTLSDDLRKKLKLKRTPEPETEPKSEADKAAIKARVLAMIERKKQYGNLNHGGVTGTGMSNDLFDDPDHLLQILQQKKIVIPGNPGASRLLTLFEIGRPMYKVFTEAEQQLWRDWIASLTPDSAPVAAVAPVDPVPPDSGSAAPRRYKRLLLSSSAEAFRAHPQGRLRGRGAVQ